MSQKIYIDPGHSSIDPGAVKYVVERDLNEKVAKFMNEYLLATYVCETKVCPISIDSLTTIANDANAWGADLFVSIHFNAGGGDGWEGLVYSSTNQALGRVFEKYVVAIGQNSRGVKYRPDLGVLRLTDMKAILNEGAFVDNQKDIADWDEGHELKKMGVAYAEAAAEWLGLAKKVVKPATPAPAPETKPEIEVKAGNYASKLLEVALAEDGYLEKASKYNLDSKTGNAGYNNYTKYARDLDALGYFYNGPKNGYAWCDVFVDWCFVQAFGPEAAMNLLQQPQRSYGAGCYYSAKYYKDKGQLYTSPKAGDQIFFWNSSKSELAHTGLVYAVDASYVYTIEGNTSSSSGVVANGGGVFKKKYARNYSRIYGYGRPNYDAESNASPTINEKVEYNYVPTVKEWQLAAIADGFKFPKYGADGEWGAECEGVATNAIVKKRWVYTNKNLTKIVQKVVGVEPDGKCGKDTDAAIHKYQSLNGLEVDGEVGINTWKKMLKV